MKRCFVCDGKDDQKKFSKWVYTYTQEIHEGHSLCFGELNKELLAEKSPFRWKLVSGGGPNE